MNLDKIRKHLTGSFRPFVIRTSDGREFDVPHPEFIAVGKGDIAVGKGDIAVVDKDGDINVLEALHIVSLKSLKMPATK